MPKNLVIVESPAKAKTIEKFLGADFVVKSSFGHVRDLSKTKIGIDVENGFQPDYILLAEKKKVVEELIKLAKTSDTVWLATDEDREGEAISWHLTQALKLDPAKVNRIVFHEITAHAIKEAVEKPRPVDMNLVNAQQARRVLDRLVGFELSPILWKKVRPALSAGRVQSVAVRLIVEREDEINSFTTESSFRITADFLVKKGTKTTTLRAEHPQRFKTREEAIAFLKKCIGADFTVEGIEKKPASKTPAPPFTTSTLQQEAARKLGFSVAKTMMVAQQLYEEGKITYMRTDSVNLSKLVLKMAREEIVKLYGEKYSKTRQYTTKSKGAQEAHEAIRPTYFSNYSVDGDASQKKLYDLIWKRTVASQMSDAQLERTIINIAISTTPDKLQARGEVILFDGFLKLYLESSDDDQSEETRAVLPALVQGENLPLQKMDAVERFSQSPPRYTEASLVKKLEELGIGRPSTYAPIISTIQKREYVVKDDRQGYNRDYLQITLQKSEISEVKLTEKAGYEKNKLFPTDLGIVVNKFLLQHFIEIMDYNFTANVEIDFDKIAQGRLEWPKMIQHFYKPFHRKVEQTHDNTGKFSGERLIGQDATGKNVYVKIGRFGPLVQIGETGDKTSKPKFAGLRAGQSIETISLEEALKLFEFPRYVGLFENKDVVVAIGRFGPYLKHSDQNYALSKKDDPQELSIDKAIEIIHEKRKKESERIICVFQGPPEVKVLNGRFGPYITSENVNYKIPKNTEPSKLSFADCLNIIQQSIKNQTNTNEAKPEPKIKQKASTRGKTEKMSKKK